MDGFMYECPKAHWKKRTGFCQNGPQGLFTGLKYDYKEVGYEGSDRIS
jgi:hypothetical protein